MKFNSEQKNKKGCQLKTENSVTLNQRQMKLRIFYVKTRDLPGECSGNISHSAISHKNQRYKEITQCFDFRPYLCLDSFYFLNSYSKGKVSKNARSKNLPL